MNKEKEQFVDNATRWLMPNNDPELEEMAKASYGLDGVYTGKSHKIYRMVRLAYLRGCRKGASAVWQGQQPVNVRGSNHAGES